MLYFLDFLVNEKREAEFYRDSCVSCFRDVILVL